MQIIADKNENFNVKVFLIIKNKLENDIRKIYEDLDIEIEEKIKGILTDSSILKDFRDNNIKKKVKFMYKSLVNKNIDLITLDDYYEYITKHSTLKMEIPFCIIITKNINLCNKNVFIYYADYFSKSAIYTLKFFTKLIEQNQGNTISLCESKNVIDIKISSFMDIEKMDKINIILSSEKYILFFLLVFTDICIIIEAKYEKIISKIVDLFIESGKDIYVVPSGIFNKNSYFSNYLIKQGADIILSANDLKLILKDNIR